jgi:hypothetical protein
MHNIIVKATFKYGSGDWKLRKRDIKGLKTGQLDFYNHHIQTCSVVHPAPYPMGTRDSFLRGKAARA